MESGQKETRSVDVAGLSEEAIRSVESVVAAFREQKNDPGVYGSPEEWCKALREWAEGHERLDNAADWSRDTIYAGRGE